MFYYHGQSCPVCGKEFTEDDDIVSCPQCGAPHHRACWQQEGHCHFEDRHGTPDQWVRPEESDEKESAAPPPPPVRDDVRHCPYCGAENPTYAEFCSRCGRPLTIVNENRPPVWHNDPAAASYSPFHAPAADSTGGLPRDMLLDEDVTVGEASLAVGVNQAYYLPRFARMNERGHAVSWNWAALLFGPYWLFYRKNYGMGALVLIARTLLSVLASVLVMVNLDSAATYATTQQMYTVAMNNMSNAEWSLLVAISIAEILLSLIMGLFGTYIYRHGVLNRCRKLRAQHPEDYMARLPIEGGASGALFFMALVVSYVLPYLVLLLI